MKQLYDKNQLTFALVWIALYCALQSLANPLSDAAGIPYAAHAAVNILLTDALLLFLEKNGLRKQYGLCQSAVPARRLLWYLPLIALSSNNLWNGVTTTLPLAGTLCYLCAMLCVGILEELIFRGFLFRAMAAHNVTSAIIVSSLTFGMGHLLNLVNGSGMRLTETLFQVAGAIAIGFLFVTLFVRTGSLLPCILSHSAINMLSAFANETGLTWNARLIWNSVTLVIAASYTVFLAKTLPRQSLCARPDSSR